MIFAWDVSSTVSFAECQLLAALSQGKRVLEIGSWLGRSTIAIASTADSVVTVDWHKGDKHSGYEETLPGLYTNLERYGCHDVEVIVGRIEDKQFDLIRDDFDGVFIDAAHDVSSVRVHHVIAADLCKPNGWIAFHDYGVKIPGFGVTEVVDQIGGILLRVETVVVIRA